VSVGLVGNCAEVLPELLRRGVVPDVLTDQTSAHDELNGYIPAGLSLEQAATLRERDPAEYVRRSMDSMRVHCEAMVELMRAGAVTFDYGNNLRGQARDAGYADAFAFPGFVPAYVRPLFCEGKGPFRWARCPATPPTSTARTSWCSSCSRTTSICGGGSGMARERIAFQGLPARICWLGQGEREVRRGAERSGRVGRAEVRPSSSGATISTRAVSHRRTARRRRCWTAAMRSRTGRS
jgi:urocanate hydratase